MGIKLTVIALLYILCNGVCTNFRYIAINAYSEHVYDYTRNSRHSGISFLRFLYTCIHLRTTWLQYIVLFNFFDPAGWPTLILIKISVGQPAGSKKLNKYTITTLVANFYVYSLEERLLQQSLLPCYKKLKRVKFTKIVEAATKDW